MNSSGSSAAVAYTPTNTASTKATSATSPWNSTTNSFHTFLSSNTGIPFGHFSDTLIHTGGTESPAFFAEAYFLQPVGEQFRSVLVEHRGSHSEAYHHLGDSQQAFSFVRCIIQLVPTVLRSSFSQVRQLSLSSLSFDKSPQPGVILCLISGFILILQQFRILVNVADNFAFPIYCFKTRNPVFSPCVL